MVEILARVPARSVYRSKCVAKSWRDLIDDPLHRSKLPQTLEGFFFSTTGCDGMENFGFVNVLARSVPLDVDPCFSFLTKLPETEHLLLLDSCNGLLLFEHVLESQPFDALEFIVCNPATKQWVTIPTGHCGCPSPTDDVIFLVFDPAVSSHFHLIQFWEEDSDEDDLVISVHAYSSESRMWSHNQTDWDEQGHFSRKHAFFNGLLHLVVMNWEQDYTPYIVALDVQGKTQRRITLPPQADGNDVRLVGYIGQSQGRLHYINQGIVAHDSDQSYDLSIWVLQDYDTQEWVLKDTVSLLKLFGRRTATKPLNFSVFAIHPDCNVVFFLLPLSGRLIAYDMDHKEVSVIATFEKECWGWRILPYIPYFSESISLRNNH